MDQTKIANLWIPVCCERVMRFNIFMQKNGTPYGSLVCTECNKNVSFELEHEAKLSAYGEGARVLNMLASPKPPKDVRHKGDQDTAMNDQTL